MEIKDFKFNDLDFAGKGIANMPTIPGENGYSTQQVKDAFDQIPKVIMALGKINLVYDFLESSEASASIGAILPSGTEGKLQQALIDLKQLNDAVVLSVSDLAGLDRNDETVMEAYKKIKLLAGEGITIETVMGAYQKILDFSNLLLSEEGSSKVGTNKLFDSDMSGNTVHDKLLKLAEMVTTIDKFTPRGIVDKIEDMPATGNAYGDFFYVKTLDPQEYDEYVWTKSEIDSWQFYGKTSLYILSGKADRDLKNISDSTFKQKSELAKISASKIIFNKEGTTIVAEDVENAVKEIDSEKTALEIRTTALEQKTERLPAVNVIVSDAVRILYGLTADTGNVDKVLEKNMKGGLLNAVLTGFNKTGDVGNIAASDSLLKALSRLQNNDLKIIKGQYTGNGANGDRIIITGLKPVIVAVYATIGGFASWKVLIENIYLAMYSSSSGIKNEIIENGFKVSGASTSPPSLNFNTATYEYMAICQEV